MDTQAPNVQPDHTNQPVPYPQAPTSQFPPQQQAAPQSAPPGMERQAQAQPQQPAAAPYDPAASYDPLNIEVDFKGYVDRNLPAGWYLLAVDFEAGPEVRTKNGDPKVIVKTKVIQAENGDTSLAGRFGPTSHCEVGSDNPFGLAALLKQGFGIDLPKGRLTVNLRELIGRPVWGRVQPQKNNDTYTEIREWKRADTTIGGAPAGGIPAVPGTGIAGRI